jgi:hypothetical protein
MKEDYNMSKDMSSEWDYRVVRRTSDGESGERLSVQEVYYDDETQEPMAHTMDLMVESDSITDLRKTLQRMLWSLDKEIVDEIESDVTTETIEDRLLNLENEVEDIRDVVSEFDNRVTRSIH